MKPLYLEVFAIPSQFSHSKLNGENDASGNMPCIITTPTNMDLWGERCWNPLINLSTGTIENWNAGNTASICYKVCDQGLYFLQFEKGVNSLKWNDWYAPEEYLSQNFYGFGDYIFMEIDENGKIKDWKYPKFNRNKWIGVDEEIT